MEQWTKWEPVAGLKPNYDINSVVDDLNGFKVLLREASINSKHYVEIIFKNSVDAYSSADETYRSKLMRELNETYGPEFCGNWTLFKVEQSSYLQWLSNQSHGISDDRNLLHFSLITNNSVLDIVCCYEPKIKIITKK